MKTSKIIKYTITLLVFVIAMQVWVKAQENTMYFMKNNVQRIHSNPAYQIGCKYFVELPVLGGIQYAYNNNAFGYNNLVKPGTGIRADSMVLNFDGFVSKLGRRNFIRNDFSVNILGGGMRKGDNMFSVNITNHTITRFGFSKDLFAIAYGNWDTETDSPVPLDFSGITLDISNYTSIAFTYSKASESGSFGITAKYLAGGINANIKNNTAELITEKDPMALTTNIHATLNTSAPITLEYDEYGIVTGYSSNFSSPIGDLLFTGNRGVAFDVGVIRQVSETMVMAASIVDIGFLNWKKQAFNYTAEGSFRFQGLDMNQYLNELQDMNLSQYMMDSLKNSFNFVPSANSYTNMLVPKLYAGVDIAVNSFASLGILGRFMYYDKMPDPAVTVSLNAQPLSFLSVGASYSYMNRSPINLGLHLGVGSKIAQFYLAADNIPLTYTKVNSLLLIPYNARTFNIRTGINILFGCRDQKPHTRGTKSNRYCPAY